MKSLLLALLTCCFAGLGLAKAIPERFVSALQRALDADATWEMTKTLPQAKHAITSSGLASCWQEKGMIWKTLEPFEEEIRMAKTEMTFIVDDEVEVKPYDEMPYYEAICDATDDFLKGDTDAFDDLFDWTWEAGDGDSWTMILKVRYRQMRRLFTTITLTGRETLETVTFLSGDASKGQIHLKFNETSRGQHTLWTIDSETK